MSELLLGIESSCDETAAAVVRGGTRDPLVGGQEPDRRAHAPFGGVVPEIAGRSHLRAILPVVDQALAAAGIGLDDLDGDRRHQPAGPDRLAPRRSFDREGARLRPRPAARGGGPHRGPRLLGDHGATGGRGVPVRRAGGLGRPHGALPRRTRRSRWSSWRRRSTTRPAKPSTRSPGCSACPTRAGPSIARLAIEGDPRRFAFPRCTVSAKAGRAAVLLQRPQDRGALPPARTGRPGADAGPGEHPGPAPTSPHPSRKRSSTRWSSRRSPRPASSASSRSSSPAASPATERSARAHGRGLRRGGADGALPQPGLLHGQRRHDRRPRLASLARGPHGRIGRSTRAPTRAAGARLAPAGPFGWNLREPEEPRPLGPEPSRAPAPRRARRHAVRGRRAATPGGASRSGTSGTRASTRTASCAAVTPRWSSARARRPRSWSRSPRAILEHHERLLVTRATPEGGRRSCSA